MPSSHPLRLAVALLGLTPALAAAQQPAVTAEEILAAQRKKPVPVIVDTRTAAEYEAVHVRGALHLPPERVAAEAARLPKDKATPIVFYCRGPG
jgi:rhodanese-related sulfurtransferase